MPIKSHFLLLIFGKTVSKHMPQRMPLVWRKSNSIGSAPPKRSKTQFCTHHFWRVGAAGAERKEMRSWSLKIEWSWAMAKAPLIYPRHVMSRTLIGRIRWHAGTSLTFLGQTERRAVHPQSSGSRPLEGDRAIFRRQKDCVQDSAS